MKITLLNTDDFTGGAAIACRRLLKALRGQIDLEAEMWVQEAKTGQKGVRAIGNSWIFKKKAFLRFIAERVYFLFYEKSKAVRYLYNPGKFGIDISDNQLVKEADIIHLHWINFGFLSIDSIEKLGKTGKPIVWTLHDMWAFTGGCHHSGNCENYQHTCGNCSNFLKNPSKTDLSNKVWQSKKKAFANNNITLVACSAWLANRAKKSSLFFGNTIVNIPNPIDIEQFKPFSKNDARLMLALNPQKKYILFTAMNVTTQMKGFEFFNEAINLLLAKNHILKNEIELLIFGKAQENDFNNLPFKANFLGHLTDYKQIATVYNAATVFVIPSLQENLPNTIIEAMACGTPVVGFNIGGIPEMIDHKKTGYLANYKDAEDLANGIAYILNAPDYEQLCQNSRRKAVENYSEEVVVNQYKKLYESILQ